MLHRNKRQCGDEGIHSRDSDPASISPKGIRPALSFLPSPVSNTLQVVFSSCISFSNICLSHLEIAETGESNLGRHTAEENTEDGYTRFTSFFPLSISSHNRIVSS